MVAQRAAIGALKDDKHLKESINTAKEGRDFLFKELSSIDKVNVFPSNANFLLIKLSGEKTSTEVAEGLFKEGIIIRDCKHFKGLHGNYIRISIGTPTENRKFLECFKKVIG